MIIGVLDVLEPPFRETWLVEQIALFHITHAVAEFSSEYK